MLAGKKGDISVHTKPDKYLSSFDKTDKFFQRRKKNFIPGTESVGGKKFRETRDFRSKEVFCHEHFGKQN